ncbi:MAG TPA: hypothetical protein VIV61_10435 [Candidatus Ozemobacteraceae bacterium]
MKRHVLLLILVLSCMTLPFAAGCGGKSGEAISDGPFRGGIVPVRITRSSGMQDGIFGYAGGSGVTGGWIEHPEGTKLLNSDFFIDNLKSWYQTTLYKNWNSFGSGDYYLKYTIGGETKTLLCPNLSWTLLRTTWNDSPPNYSYDSNSNIISVFFKQISSSGKVKYYIRLSREGTNYVLYESTPQENAIQLSEYLIGLSNTPTDEYEMQVFGDVYENDVLKSRYIHLFTNVSLN